jgi:hypothetical protein
MNFKHIVISLLFCLPLFTYAQQQEMSINGIFFRQNTSDRIAQATITDTRSQVIMMSDELGGFTIKAAKGDTLIFNKSGYTPFKQVVTGPGDLVIYLHPVVVLPQVTIKGESKKQELNDVTNEYRSKGLYFDGKPPWYEFIASPLTAFYELFGQDAKNERHFIRFSKMEMEAIAVSNRYNKPLVKRVTQLSDADVDKFMQQYTPSYEDIQQWNDYDLITHIKKYLVYFNKHKDGIPVQKLY